MRVVARFLAPLSPDESGRRIVDPGELVTVPADRAVMLILVGYAELDPVIPPWWTDAPTSGLNIGDDEKWWQRPSSRSSNVA
jgi:hypothetical protein